MTALLMVIAFLVGLGGLLLASNATAGVAVLSFACLIAILGRIAQADSQHKEIMATLERTQRTTGAREASAKQLSTTATEAQSASPVVP